MFSCGVEGTETQVILLCVCTTGRRGKKTVGGKGGRVPKELEKSRKEKKNQW